MEINHLLAPSEEYNITPIYEGVHITKMPRQDKGEDVMTVSYDKGFQNERSCLLVGHNSKGDLYIENEFTGYEADMLYMLLKREMSIADIIKF